MMVSPVSFRATSASSFQDMIKKPQTYTQQPVASTTIESENKKKGKAGKVVLGLAFAAAAVTGGLVAISKFNGQINDFIEKTIKNEKVAGYLQSATNKATGWGNAISAKVTGLISSIKTKVGEIAQNVEPEKVVEQAAEQVAEAAENIQ